MSLYKEQIERLCRKKHKSYKWEKNQMNRYIRRQKVSVDDIGCKIGRKPTVGWEY